MAYKKWHLLLFSHLFSWASRWISGCILRCLGIFETLLFNPYMVTVFMGYYCLVHEKYLWNNTKKAGINSYREEILRTGENTSTPSGFFFWQRIFSTPLPGQKRSRWVLPSPSRIWASLRIFPKRNRPILEFLRRRPSPSQRSGRAWSSSNL